MNWGMKCGVKVAVHAVNLHTLENKTLEYVLDLPVQWLRLGVYHTVFLQLTANCPIERP
jgi:hypothetical protein